MRQSKGFRPAVLHPAALITLLLSTLLLIGLIEYACRVLPITNDRGSLSGILDTTSSRVRRFDSNSPKKRTIQILEQTTVVTIVARKPQTSAPNPDAFLNTDPTTIPTQPVTEPDPDVSPETPTSTFVTPTPLFTPNPDAYLKTNTLTPTETAPGAPNPDAFLETDTPTPPGPPLQTPNPDAYLNTDTTLPPGTPTLAPNPDAFLQTDTTTLPPGATPLPPGATPATPNPHLHTTSIRGGSGNNGNPGASPTPGAPNSNAFLQGDKHDSGQVTGLSDYILGTYVPTIIAVFFALPWVIVDHSAKYMEPFYQLSKPGGASADSTLTANFNFFATPLLSLFRGQWIISLTALLMFLASLITPIAPEAVSIYSIGACSATTVGCTGRIAVFLPAARAIQGMLAIMAILTIIMIAATWNRRAQTSSNPHGIAGLASLFSDVRTRSDFKNICFPASGKEVSRALKGRTYALESSLRSDGLYTTRLVTTTYEHDHPSSNVDKHEYAALNWDQKLQPRRQHLLSASLFFAILVGLVIVIVVYRYTGGETGFEKFMSGQGFGVRFLFTLVGVIISMYWRKVYHGIAVMAPYRRLAEGNATARETILMTTPSHPVLAFHSALFTRHYFLAAISAATLLSEVLTVTLSTIPFSSATLWKAYVVSTWISVAIIGVMLLTLLFLFFYKEPKLPIKPTTLAAQLACLCDSSLPDLFANLGATSTQDRNKAIDSLGYRYRLMATRDAEMLRLTIDCEDSGVLHYSYGGKGSSSAF